MDIDRSKALLDIFIENSSKVLRSGFGVNYAEPSFFSVIDFLKEEPALKDYLIPRISSVLRENDPTSVDLKVGKIPVELIELIAHEMRWDELRALANQRIKDKYNGDWSFAPGDISQRIIDALGNKWEDRQFYKRYSQQ